MDTETKYIFINCKNVLIKIFYKDINYVQANGDYINIYTSLKRFSVHMTLRKFSEIVKQESFYRCHRSYLINMDNINTIEGMTCYIEKHPIPIGEQYKKELLNLINYI